MHRKVIAALLTYGQNGEAVTPLRPKDSAALLLLSRARFPYNRKSTLKFWIFTFVSLFSAVFLFAKPDPDLFDGRLATRSYDSESGSTAGSPDPGGGVEGGEQRDIESVGDPDEGEAAGSTSSKYSSTTEGVRESSGTAATQAARRVAGHQHVPSELSLMNTLCDGADVKVSEVGVVGVDELCRRIRQRGQSDLLGQ